MSPGIAFLLVLSQAALVGGQILLKIGMSAFGRTPPRPPRALGAVAGGTAALTVWFFAWMELLRKRDLSFVYPFEGLSPILLVLVAAVFLGERVGWKTWLGVVLVGAGTLFVGLSG